MKIICRTAFMILSLVSFCSGSNQDKFLKAVTSYQQNDFSTALTLFRELNQEAQSPGLYYNIGNCYIKMGKIGLGLSAYYSAVKRDPSDANLRHNLKYAKTLTKDQLPDEEEITGIRDVFIKVIRYFSISFHRLLFAFFFLLFLVITGYYGIGRQSYADGKILIAFFAALLILQGAVLKIRYLMDQTREGVIIVPEEKVKYGPGITDTTAFLLHEGTKFQIHSQMGEWVQIQISDDKVGWIPLNSLEEIK
ncbi:MAG: hypothetical protein JW774_12755 [Candidatus Aureabacteria bacterium]|nr:hypothetical protein [Candidatus Auribacterota bacterium]